MLFEPKSILLAQNQQTRARYLKSFPHLLILFFQIFKSPHFQIFKLNSALKNERTACNSMNTPTGLRHIFLVRHYEPDVERSGFFNAAEASKFISDYDAADLVKTSFQRPAGLPEKIPKVYCSTLPRAKQTARLLFGEETQLIENADFNEFQRKIFQLPLFRFPIEVWLAAARFSWILGLNSRGIETFRQARKRALHCAETLARYAETENEVVLVAHGFLNAFIRLALKKLGWRIARHDGNAYLGVTQLTKPHSLQVPEKIAEIMAAQPSKNEF